jgi:transposase
MDSSSQSSSKRPRRRFTAEFKSEAVRLLLKSGRPLAQVARELGVDQQVLRNWKRQASASDGKGVRPDHFAQEEENRRLRRELARVTEERDILKKATAFFANQSR